MYISKQPNISVNISKEDIGLHKVKYVLVVQLTADAVFAMSFIPLLKSQIIR